MKLSDAYPGKYLKSGDLPEEGNQTAVIENVKVEEIGANKEEKPVVHFSNLDKGMVLNKTNWKTIARALGSEDTDDWIGKTISLYRAEVEFQGEMVEAIRVRLKTVKTAPIPKGGQPDDLDDEIPF